MLPMTRMGLFTNWDKRFDKFRDLIYTPLDLPDPPLVDSSRLLSWVDSLDPNDPTQNLVIKDSSGKTIGKTSRAYVVEKLKYYPWVSAYAKQDNSLVSNNNGWQKDFVSMFPELVEYVNLFPFKEINSVNFIIQKESMPVFIHVDPDDYFGMRIYLQNNVNSDLLYFYKTKEKKEERPVGIFDNESDSKLKNMLDMSNKIYAKHPKERYAWMITSVRAMHGVDQMPNTYGNKITVLLSGKSRNPGEEKFDQDKLYDLFCRSVEKYSQYCIWY